MRSASSRNFPSVTISEQGVFATQGAASFLGKKCASELGAGGLPWRSVRDLKAGSLATSKGGKDHDADHRDCPVDSAFRWRGRLLLQKTGTLVGRCPAPHRNPAPKSRPADYPSAEGEKRLEISIASTMAFAHAGTVSSFELPEHAFEGDFNTGGCNGRQQGDD